MCDDKICQDALASDRGENAPPELECEYCYKREKELCSPMVLDFSAEEAEEFLKEQEAVSTSLVLNFFGPFFVFLKKMHPLTSWRAHHSAPCKIHRRTWVTPTG